MGGAAIATYEIVLHGTLGDDTQAALPGSSCRYGAGTTIVTSTISDHKDLTLALEVFAAPRPWTAVHPRHPRGHPIGGRGRPKAHQRITTRQGCAPRAPLQPDYPNRVIR